jgi:hypothetical protein
MRSDINDTGVLHMRRGAFHYYNNVDTGALVINHNGRPLFRFNPQCFVSDQAFLWWITDVHQAIEYLHGLGKEVEW